MRKIFSLALLSVVAMCAWAAEKTDVIPGSLTITADYVQQVLDCESGAAWLVTLKNDGNGPQFKPGSGGIVTKTSIGKVRKVSVTWGSKSNENIVVYGSHEPIASPLEISGTKLGTVAFSAGATTSLDIEGDWEYIGMTATAVKGKACQFVSVEVKWETAGAEPEADPQEGIVLNEICGNDGTATDGSEDWIELANATDRTISYDGIKIVKVEDNGEEETLYTTPVTEDIKELKAGEYMLLKRMVNFESGISNSKNIIIKIVSAKGNVIDKFDKRAALTNNGHHNAGGSYSRIPDMKGEWAAVQNCTPGKANDATPIEEKMESFWAVNSEEALFDGMKFVIATLDESKIDDSYATNNDPLPAFAMSSSWATTKDGGVYQLAETATIIRRDPQFTHIAEHVTFDANRVAVLTLESAGDGKWGIKFGETNNYQNENRYLACEAFKKLDFKKSIDKKGVACTISFDALGYAVISYGELAGNLLFNYKGDGTDRFMNYDPTDKPDEHKAVRIYCYMDELPVGISNVSIENADHTATYNLAGQKVAADYRGIVIRNGRKMLQK